MKEIQTLDWVEELPRSKSAERAAEYAPLREDLAQRPGYWARLADFDEVKGARSLTMKLRHDGYKFSWRQTGDHQWSVFGKCEVTTNGDTAA